MCKERERERERERDRERERERALSNSPLNEDCTGVNITSYIWKVRFQEGMYALI